MIKRLIQLLLRQFGLAVVKYEKPADCARKKTVRSDKLGFYQTGTGDYFLPEDACADRIVAAIKENKIFDEAVYSIAVQFIRADTIALDVGSNFGQMAILFSKLVGKAGQVYAFDADDFVFEILQKNVRQNAQNIIPIFGAVHDKSNETLYFPVQDFKRYGTYGSYGIDYVHAKGRPVKSVVIDDIDFKLPISFMKIDVQGGDLFAMKGSKATIAKHRMPIIFEYEYLFEEELNLHFQEYVDFVDEIGYTFSRVIDGHNYLILPKEVVKTID